MKLYATLSLASLYLATSITPIYAQQMEGSNTVLELNEYEAPITNPTATPGQPVISKPIPQEKPEETFILPTQRADSLSLESSINALDFGILSPTTPTKRTVTFSITGTTEDIIMYVFENHDLRSENGINIPKTSCDSGTCSDHVAATWDSTLSFGLGYSCLGSLCDADFTSSKFRPFSTTLTSFASGTLGVGNKKEITIPVSLNIPGTQESGIYDNTLLFMVVPRI